MRLKENEMMDIFVSQEDGFGPLGIKEIERQYRISNFVMDARIDFAVGNGISFKAAVEFVILSTPKGIAEKIRMLREYASELKAGNWVPVIIAPYIRKKESDLLLKEGISWIDLSGNMIIKAPPSIYIEKTGRPNKYPDSSPIKNIYKGTSSLVCRALLLRPEGFSSLNKIVEFINERNGAITLATVSKVLKSLEEEMIIDKSKENIRVRRPAALLENLAAGYVEYFKRQSNRRYKYDIENINKLQEILFNAQVDYAYGGFYAAQLKGLGVTNQITLYVKSVQDIRKALQNKSDIAMPDEEYGRAAVIETDNPGVWFNIQKESPQIMVDDLELYLEMIDDKPRGPKIAEQLKEQILGKKNG